MKASFFPNSAALVLIGRALGSLLMGQPHSRARADVFARSLDAIPYDLLIEPFTMIASDSGVKQVNESVSQPRGYGWQGRSDCVSNKLHGQNFESRVNSGIVHVVVQKPKAISIDSEKSILTNAGRSYLRIRTGTLVVG